MMKHVSSYCDKCAFDRVLYDEFSTLLMDEFEFVVVEVSSRDGTLGTRGTAAEVAR